MAIVQVNFLSKALFRTVNFTAVIPADKLPLPGSPAKEQKPFKTLYLLHGLLGSEVDYISGTRIQRWAEEKDLAVIMPSGENGFYVDQEETGRLYGQFIGEELVEFTRKLFPLSDKREDTFIGGLSMGGYGAVRNGLKYYDTFGSIIAMSAALQIFEAEEGESPATIAYEESCFGDLQLAKKSDKNPRVLIDELVKKQKSNPEVKLPRIFLTCGTEDSLIEVNRLYKELFETNGFDIKYIEAKGGHEWDFWDAAIKKALDWLPLEEASEGLNSGHVGV